MRLQERPCALVHRLVLREHELGVRVAVEHLLKLVGRQRVVLLEANERDRGVLELLESLLDLVVELARVDDDATHRVLVLDALVIEHRLESARGEVLKLRDRTLETQHRLRREDDERTTRAHIRLATEQVEVRRGRRRLRDRHVLFRRKRKETLDARRGVVRALAFVAVGKQEHDARALVPLLLA